MRKPKGENKKKKNYNLQGDFYENSVVCLKNKY